MNRSKDKYILWIILGALSLIRPFNVYAQRANYPEIGKPCPDFSMKGLSGEVISLSSLKGKHFILDFWTVGCIPCVAAFPEVNELQRQFPDSLRIIHVGTQYKNRDVTAFYKKFQNKYEMTLMSSIDSIVFKRFVHRGVPFAVWVDSGGTIKAITGGDDITKNNILRFLNNERLIFSDFSYKALKSGYDPTRPKDPGINEVIPNVDQTIFISRIDNWVEGTENALPRSVQLSERSKSGLILASNLDLKELYSIAYFEDFLNGDYYRFPILRLQDSSLFKYSYHGKLAAQRFNYIYYNRRNPPNSAEQRMLIMQEDLKRAFPYKVRVIVEKMPCYELIVIDSAKLLKTIRESEKIKQRFAEWKIESKVNRLYQVPVRNLASIFGAYMPFPIKSYDKTEIDAVIDLTFHGSIDSLENIQTQIRKIGLDFVLSKRPTKVLEIRD